MGDSETICKESEKNVNGYLLENVRLINEIKKLEFEIRANILGGAAENENEESVFCMLDVVRSQNQELKKIANGLLVTRDAIIAK